VADVADRIAYNCHDLEDGMRARLIDGNQMRHLELYAEAAHRVAVERIPDWTIRRTRVAKTVIDHLVSDCVAYSRAKIAAAGIQTAYDACRIAEDLVALSPEYERRLAGLEQFLLHNLYLHPMLVEAANKVRIWLPELFGKFCREPDRMPGYFRGFIPDYGLPRAVCDYIAGMTDRYCLKLLEQA
jgi:dGTPase